ncbi:conserved hypothetical protein [Anaeromyxobacter dehalogenans 2CP-1]|uniref:Periplasmic heavy metal sensor n=1 Tax=Anaeromyxobacter dehalogenans (strain ATCC BAA-258 / DSM 21875 / 2CP-1) TaxID=455488 RepID=B8JC19_ANAD2|nr:hypothetical protein [Anaeromyxobacter dehalogenans]ACL63941.1 conserved hypothetical protein [Anaeromyxobacter dehalogenans 2CP-1]
MSRARWQVVLVLALVFLAGGATGAVVSRAVVQRAVARLLSGPPEQARASAILFRLDRDLDLTREQRAELRAVLARHRGELAAIRRTVAPQLEAARRRQWAEMREVLDERQRAGFDRFVEELERRVAGSLAASPDPAAAPIE